MCKGWPKWLDDVFFLNSWTILYGNGIRIYVIVQM